MEPDERMHMQQTINVQSDIINECLICLMELLDLEASCFCDDTDNHEKHCAIAKARQLLADFNEPDDGRSLEDLS